jgi:hypothetical protein
MYKMISAFIFVISALGCLVFTWDQVYGEAILEDENVIQGRLRVVNMLDISSVEIL